MAVSDIVVDFKNLFGAQVEASKLRLQEDMGLLDKAVALETEIAIKEKADFDAGFNAGLAQAGQLNGEGKIYSDAELEAELAPLKAQIAELGGKIDALVLDKDVLIGEKAAMQVELDAVPAKIAEAVALMKAELLAKWEESQKDDAAFADLLK